MASRTVSCTDARVGASEGPAGGVLEELVAPEDAEDGDDEPHRDPDALDAPAERPTRDEDGGQREHEDRRRVQRQRVAEVTVHRGHDATRRAAQWARHTGE